MSLPLSSAARRVWVHPRSRTHYHTTLLLVVVVVVGLLATTPFAKPSSLFEDELPPIIPRPPDVLAPPEEIARTSRVKKWDIPEGYELPSAKLSGPRPPGTLLLNMLIKNEREHLDRTLPRWAKIIDCWIIGVDDANTDDSREVIMKHLGHIPGHIVTVHFDGMGPTWSILVKEGVIHYPQCTHGIIADADFAPINLDFDKMDLDIRCSKHMYTIWTQDHKHERRMDWIYRNVHGAHVARRTHQILEVPVLPDQEVFQTLVNLHIEERAGGYQDRTPGKMERYIGFLEKDLAEIPDDTRSLYYLGYAHFEIFMQSHQDPKPEHWAALGKAVDYFKRRVNINAGNFEENWFTQLKLGEIYERFYRDRQEAERYYRNCTELDGERADGWFYLGQLYRLSGQPRKALPYLKRAATLEMPERALFQWHALYKCISKLEYARALAQLPPAELKPEYALDGISVLRTADCVTEDLAEYNRLMTHFQKIAQRSQPGDRKPTLVEERIRPIRMLLKHVATHRSHIENLLGSENVPDYVAQPYLDLLPVNVNGEPDTSYYSVLEFTLDRLRDYREHFLKLKSTDKAAAKQFVASCREFRRATIPFLRLMRQEQSRIQSLMHGNEVFHVINQHAEALREVCRG